MAPPLPNNLFSTVPSSLVTELVDALVKIETNFRERRWEPSELNGGKLSEVVYTILHGYVSGSFASQASKPSNMVDACRNLEKAGNSFPRSIRIQIPRMLIALYEIRNNRGVGHVGGDVDPNEMDATCVLQMSKWIVSELIRVFHSSSVSTDEATDIVNAISSREFSLIWEVAGTFRVLDPSLSKPKQTLLLLYARPSGITEKELVAAIEPSSAANYRRDVLRPAHRDRLLEYSQRAGTVIISPKGAKKVEDEILSLVEPRLSAKL